MQKRAIAIFPRGQELGAIEQLRKRFDPLAHRIAAHITLVFPFASDLSSAELRGHVERTIGQVPAFRIRLAGVTGHEEEYLFLGVAEGSDRVANLHDRLYTGALASSLSPVHTYLPHVTVGRLADRDAFSAALAETGELPLALATDVREVAVIRLEEPGPYATELVVALRP